MNTEFFAWHSKQLRLGTQSAQEQLWDLSSQHVIRPDSYKGDQEVFQVPGVNKDCCTTAGLLLLLGLLAQVRQQAAAVQTQCVSFLRRLFNLASFASGLLVLPDLKLKVDSGQVKIKKLFRKFGAGAEAVLRQRPFWEVHIFFLVSSPHGSTLQHCMQVDQLCVARHQPCQRGWLCSNF